MTLTHVFTVIGSINLALGSLAEVMLSELVLVARLVVNFRPAEVIMRLSIHHNAIFLGHHLRFMRD